MKFKSLIVAAAAFAGLAMTSIANAADLELLQPGKLLVATEGTYAPFSMRSPDGKLDGLEIRVMKEVAKRLNLEYTPVLIKWDSLLVGLQADQFDVISAAMDITEARQKQVTFSNGWLESGGRVVTAKNSPIKSAADLKGKTVGALVSSTWTKIAEEKAQPSRATRLSPMLCRIWSTAMSMPSSPIPSLPPTPSSPAACR